MIGWVWIKFKIIFDYKRIFLNTFITTNIVEDLGKITAMPKARIGTDLMRFLLNLMSHKAKTGRSIFSL
jgi:hypothetical protein